MVKYLEAKLFSFDVSTYESKRFCLKSYFLQFIERENVHLNVTIGEVCVCVCLSLSSRFYRAVRERGRQNRESARASPGPP